MNFTIFNKETKALKLCTIANLSMLVIALIGMLIDERQLLGENVWLKPAKFAISIPIYCITIALLLPLFPYSSKRKKLLSSIIGWVLILEIPLVMIQATRGVRSHFNNSSALDGGIFGMMGILILINTLVIFYMMGTTFFKKLNTTVTMQRALQFGWVAMIISIMAARNMLAANGHAVGVPDGGEGIPITHWSTKGGDWRAVHFLGMHGIQILPLLAYFLGKKEVKKAQLIIWITGLTYIGFISYIYWKTQAGMPFLTV